MLRAISPNENTPEPAYRVPWQIDRREPRHPLITNAAVDSQEFVRVFIQQPLGDSEAEHWGPMPPGYTKQLCLCGIDPDGVLLTIAWFRPETDEEYVWAFVV